LGVFIYEIPRNPIPWPLSDLVLKFFQYHLFNLFHGSNELLALRRTQALVAILTKPKLPESRNIDTRLKGANLQESMDFTTKHDFPLHQFWGCYTWMVKIKVSGFRKTRFISLKPTLTPAWLWQHSFH
jgi:hypothetical protein